MAAWNFFKRTPPTPPEPSPKRLENFLKVNLEANNVVFHLTLSNGKRCGLAQAPLEKGTNKYDEKVALGRFLMLAEGDSVFAKGRWWRGKTSRLEWCPNDPDSVQPVDDGEASSGTMEFDDAPKYGPYHYAYGLDWWLNADGTRLKTLLNYYTLPDAMLTWTRYDGANSPEPLTSPEAFAPFVGNWSRSFYREGTVVRDPSEGSGFSKEGDESRFENMSIWGDGQVTLRSDAYGSGQLDETGHVTWNNPDEGTPESGTRSEIFPLQLFNGPVTAEDDQLILPGGYIFERVADTEPQ